MARLTVVFDACVLHPAPLRDLLLELAVAGLFRARWTSAIHEEWISSVLARRPEIGRERLTRTARLMDEAVPDCLVRGHERLIGIVELPDRGDRHVLAAAIHGGADAIVTFNLRDFPVSSLEPHGLTAIAPDELLQALCLLHLDAFLGAVRRCRARLRNPPLTPDEFMDSLARQSLPGTVARLRTHADRI